MHNRLTAGLLVVMLAAGAGQAQEAKRKVLTPQERVDLVLNSTAPLKHPRGKRLPLDFVFSDWEIDGPIEWNDAWDSARKCVRCRQNIRNLDTDFTAFQTAYRRIRSEMQHEAYARPILDRFPKALVGNYGVNPHDGWRYWYDWFEKCNLKLPHRLDQREPQRPWADEFQATGYTCAMPVIYSWRRLYDWYDFKNPDYRWFYNMLKEVSSVGARTAAEVPIISFVHHLPIVSPGETASPDMKAMSDDAYKELLWHALLRGHDTFFLWCGHHEIEAEVRPLHEVWAASLEYAEFLDKGTPVTFDVPKQEGPVVSGLRVGNRVLVRRTDFGAHAGPVRLRVASQDLLVPKSPGACQILELAPFRWTQMERHPENPILKARPGTWESQWFIVDTVLKVDGRWWMYYDGAGPHDKKTSALGLAFSDDGVHWERRQGNPIWSKEGNWSHFLRDVRVHRFQDEPGFWMYYSDGDRHIDLARSDDGIRWKNVPETPVLTPSQDWEDLLMQESVLKLGPGQWLMWYSTYGRKPRVTGLATSVDGAGWTKHPDNPVLKLGEPGQWDDYSAFQPWVFYRDGYYHMLYTGSAKSSPTRYQFGYAWSRNGITWRKSPDNPIFKPSDEKGAWDAGKVSMHVLCETGDDTFNIYYSGGPSPEATYGGIGLIRARLAPATLPELLTPAAAPARRTP